MKAVGNKGHFGGKNATWRNMYIKIGTPPKKHGISWVRPYGNAASTIAVGSWTPGVGPPESSESCAAALKTASKWNFPPKCSFISYSFHIKLHVCTTHVNLQCNPVHD